MAVKIKLTSSVKDKQIVIAKHLLTCSDYVMPLDKDNIRYKVKAALDKGNVKIKNFVDNMQGIDWVRAFLVRQKETLSDRICQNIKRARVEVDPGEIKEYFKNLENSLRGVSVDNILNYDEPGQKCIFRRGVKYPERIMNYSKGNISLMFSGSGSGELLPPYVIYKSEHLWRTWCEGGPPGTRFGRSKSGWMDMVNFEEWFLSIVVPWARRKEGRKVVIGDNLSSPFSGLVLDKCGELNIAFIRLIVILVLLPANATDKCQPLDVSFFTPLKKEWRKQLESFKQKNPSSASIDKSQFPHTLSKLLEGMGARNSENLKSGFRTCGIFPVNADAVLKKFPSHSDADNTNNIPLSDAVLEYLHQIKYSPTSRPQRKQKRTRLAVAPGKSISAEDLQQRSTQPTAIKAISSFSTGTSAANANLLHESTTVQEEAGVDSDLLTSSDIENRVIDSESDDEWLPPKKKKLA